MTRILALSLIPLAVYGGGWLVARLKKRQERRWNHRRAVAFNHKIIAGHRFRGES